MFYVTLPFSALVWSGLDGEREREATVASGGCSVEQDAEAKLDSMSLTFLEIHKLIKSSHANEATSSRLPECLCSFVILCCLIAAFNFYQSDTSKE